MPLPLQVSMDDSTSLHGFRQHWAAAFLARLKRMRLLGAGAFGRVFMVRDSVSGAPAALKLF